MKFIDFKERSEEHIQEAEARIKLIEYLERGLALKSPVMEAEYAIDERTALSLYDCLVPRLKEHRRFRIDRDYKFSLADFKA